MALKRLVHNEYDLQAIADRLDQDPLLVERDFVLMTITAELVEEYPGQLCFKGGFVLRHVHGKTRFSKDIDATRHAPARKRFDADDVARTIAGAGQRFVRVQAPAPSTDSPRSLDFDPVTYVGPLGEEGEVACEISYREAVVEKPMPAMIGEPFYEPFEILAMVPNEIGAEKLRCLGQRLRPTDLSDMYFVLHDLADKTSVDEIARIFPEKVSANKLNSYTERVERNIGLLGKDYTDTVEALDPDAPSYEDASALVLRVLPQLIRRP
jgi:predicted nucleotidyltransferase component of viral defense system